MKVTGANVNLNTTTFGSQVGHAQQVGKPQPLGNVLFGKVAPKKLDARDFPHLKKALQKARAMKRKLAFLAGDEDDEYELQLAEHELAMINDEGTIFVGKEFLEQFGDDDEILAGVLGHEIGHRPKTWPMLPGDVQLKPDQRHQLTREEEGKADWFAGRALAELGYTPARICALLVSLDGRGNPSKDYYPVDTRVSIIHEAHASQSRRREVLRSMFPGAARWRGARALIADDA